MRILFTTEKRQAVSTVLNVPNFARLSELPGVTIDFFNRNYEAYDVILFMGYDPMIADARKANPAARIGVVDPRPRELSMALGADFVIVNGLEMRDWCADYFTNIYIYYIYPTYPVSIGKR